jgi:hypothetical protein
MRINGVQRAWLWGKQASSVGNISLGESLDANMSALEMIGPPSKGNASPFIAKHGKEFVGPNLNPFAGLLDESGV